jgi:hypothetical protein
LEVINARSREPIIPEENYPQDHPSSDASS